MAEIGLIRVKRASLLFEGIAKLSYRLGDGSESDAAIFDYTQKGEL